MGNSLFALGKMHHFLIEQDENLKFAIELSIRKVLPKTKGKDLMQIVQGLSLMRYNWSILTKDTQRRLSESIFERS